MSDDQIPDVTLLRQKLGITKPTPVRPTIHDYERESRSNGAMDQVSARRRTAQVTLSSEEPEEREIDEAESAKIEELLGEQLWGGVKLRACPPACAKWLKKYIVLGNHSAAARAINYSAGTVKWWRDNYPQFRQLLGFYEEEVRLRWNEFSERKAVEGFREEVFKPDGSLKFTRMRQDPHFLKEIMKKLDPDWKDEGLGTQINITVVREEE